MLRNEQHAHATGVAHDGRANLEQLDTNRRGAGTLQFGAGQREATQIDHQGVSEGGQQQAQLVGLELVAAGAPSEQIELRFLDAVFRLAASNTRVRTGLWRHRSG